jgi:hypothetical protein
VGVPGGGSLAASADGAVSAVKPAQTYGNASDAELNAPIVGIAPTPDGHGYWLVAADGGIFAYGDAGYHGAPTTDDATGFNGYALGMSSTPDGQGYLVFNNFGALAYGDAVVPAPADGPACTAVALSAAIPHFVSLAQTYFGVSFACQGDYAWLAYYDDTGNDNVMPLYATDGSWQMVSPYTVDDVCQSGVPGEVAAGICLEFYYVLTVVTNPP